MRISDWSSDVCSSDLIDILDKSRAIRQAGQTVGHQLAAQILFRLPLARSINDRQEQASDSVRMVGQPSQGAVKNFSSKRMIAASFKFLARATGLSKPHNVLMAPVRIAFTADTLLRFGLDTFRQTGLYKIWRA